MGVTQIAFRALLAGTPLFLFAGLCGPAAAQQADRERAQMMQMQQQLQRLQSDNAAISKERNDLQSKAQDVDKLKKETDTTGKALARLRQEFAAQAKELAAVRAQLTTTSQTLASVQSDDELLRKTVAERNDAIQAANVAKRRGDAALALLGERLKFQTARGDVCEVRHEGLMKFSAGVIDRYESDRLRLCEPITGIWKIHAQSQVQEMRDTLYGFRLDIPAPAKTAASTPASAGPEPAPASVAPAEPTANAAGAPADARAPDAPAVPAAH